MGAEASECAADQDAFWAYHDKLFASQSGENQGAFNKDKLKGFAVELGLEPKAFNDCLDTGKYTQARAVSMRPAQLGVTGTPSFFVNDWPTGAVSMEDFGKLIEKAKQGIHPPPTPTPLPQGVQFYDADPNRARADLRWQPVPGRGRGACVDLLRGLQERRRAQYVKAIEPTMKDKYIKTGQIRLVVKPLADTATKAAVAAVCAPGKASSGNSAPCVPQQAEWTEGDDAAMSAYAKGVGMDQAKFETCLTDARPRTRWITALSSDNKSASRRYHLSSC